MSPSGSNYLCGFRPDCADSDELRVILASELPQLTELLDDYRKTATALQIPDDTIRETTNRVKQNLAGIDMILMSMPRFIAASQVLLKIDNLNPKIITTRIALLEAIIDKFMSDGTTDMQN